MQNQEMSSVLSSEAKPRLKWTPQLHQRFVDAVKSIGGAEKATPKSLMRVMGIPGLTLYHLKSHLQKYRLGKNHSIETCSESNHEDCKESAGELDLFKQGTSNEALDPIEESLQISQAIQIQMEIQRKLHEQIEVQRHLQLRIEAQGKYLHKVLNKAQETLSGCISSSMGVEDTKAELSELISMVNSGSLSSSLTKLTEMRELSLENLDRQIQIKGVGCSLESSLTSSDTSSFKEDKELKILPLLDQSQPLIRRRENGSSEEDNEKRGNCKRLHTFKEMEKMELLETIDLNSQAPIDLNSTEIDQLNDITLY
ncbi:hypothetical protein V2J09_019971 [Rumex salicifolius]